jgi:hypothetical protein
MVWDTPVPVPGSRKSVSASSPGVHGCGPLRYTCRVQGLGVRGQGL